ncbi:MAG: methyltransferase domain-containing protein [Pseudomonadota bacterium]
MTLGVLAAEAGTRRRVLHVGCGQKRKRHLPRPFRGADCEEVRLDINPDCDPDIVGTITDLSMVADGSIDALFSSHNIEHLFAHEVPLALAGFARVLAPGSGIAVITCPDLQAIGKRIAEGRIEEALYNSAIGPVAPLDVLYGHRGAVARGEHYMAHRTGFTGQTLIDALHRAGFSSCTGTRHLRTLTLWVIGFRWRIDEAQRRVFRKAFFPPP